MSSRWLSCVFAFIRLSGFISEREGFVEPALRHLLPRGSVFLGRLLRPELDLIVVLGRRMRLPALKRSVARLHAGCTLTIVERPSWGEQLEPFVARMKDTHGVS